MTVPPELPKTIGLALSGGGFRASFFALGALRYLAEARLLPQVRVISSVSGGSILAGVVAERWPQFTAAGASVDAFLGSDRRAISFLHYDAQPSVGLARAIGSSRTPWRRRSGNCTGQNPRAASLPDRSCR